MKDIRNDLTTHRINHMVKFHSKRSLTIFIVLSFGGIFGLSPKPAKAAESKGTWQQEWKQTVELAKKEGQLNVYFWGSTALLDEGIFQAAFPEIKVTGVTARGPQLLQRILSERRGDKYLADVYIDGLGNIYPAYSAKIFDPIKPMLILPAVVDATKWWQGKHHYTDPENKYIFRFQSTALKGMISHNTNLVNPKNFKSFWDFLQPQWKGKIEVRDIREAGPGSAGIRFFYHNSELGPNFIRRLINEMDVTLYRDGRLATDWLAGGKFALCFFCNDTDAAKRQGLPVDSFRDVLKEGAGLYQQAGSITLGNRAPHPNAAKVFINWFLSPEGQYAFQKVSFKSQSSAPDSLRIDIPKDHVLPDDRREEGVKYMDMDTPERIDMKPVVEVFSEALSKAGKKSSEGL
jgi:iron(III) transport system substrate-binding protein